MSFKDELFNQYTVHFKGRSPIVIYAKKFEKYIKDGVTMIEFIDTHISTRIEFVNSSEVYYIETTKYGVLLES